MNQHEPIPFSEWSGPRWVRQNYLWVPKGWKPSADYFRVYFDAECAFKEMQVGTGPDGPWFQLRGEVEMYPLTVGTGGWEYGSSPITRYIARQMYRRGLCR
jgi:hypothetical protein